MFLTSDNRYVCAHICLCSLGVISTYFPLYLDAPIRIDLGDLEDVIRSPEYSDSSKMAVGVTLPMLLNTVLEARDLPKEAVHRFCIQCIYILALLMPNALLLIPNTNQTLIYICSIEARDGLFFGAIFCLLATQETTVFWDRFLLFNNVLLQCTMSLYSWRKFSTNQVPLKWLTVLLSLFVFGVIIVACVRVVHIRRNTPSTVYQNTTAHCIIILLANCIAKFILVLSFGASLDIERAPGGLVVGFLWTDIVSYTITYALNSRTLRSEAAVLQEKLKQNKSFVAHISHELRTPLHAVNLGMQGIIRKVDRELRAQSRSTSTSTTAAPMLLRDAAEELKCINTATQTALQTLNEILMYDKLDSRNVQLDSQPISVADLIRLSAQSFKLQATLLDIDLLYEADLAGLENVHIKVDVSKLAQVLRNFISNALKFTSRHGRVSVRAAVVPAIAGISLPQRRPAESDSTIEPFYSEEFSHNSSTTVVNDVDRAPRPSWGIGYFAKYTFASKNNFIVKPASHRQRVRIEVKDSGVGISEENMKLLFTEGTQFDAASLQGGGGSGLGLWISKRIVNLHGGRIGATSTLNEGSIFFVELDIHELEGNIYNFLDRSQSIEMVEDTEDTEILTATKITPREISRICSDENIEHSDENTFIVRDPQKACTVRSLVVDDSAMTRKVFLHTLECIAKDAEYNILSAECKNGEEAVEEVRKAINSRWEYDVIFIDDQMPVMNGVEATKLIRDLGFHKSIILVTGNILTPGERNKFIASGGTKVLVKPCHFEDIEKIIGDIASSSAQDAAALV